MAATIEFIYTTPLSDFTGLTGPFNLNVFKREIADASLAQPFSTAQVPAGPQSKWSISVPSADLTTYDALVTAHLGGVTSGAPQPFEDLGSSNNATTTATDKLDITSELLTAGTWRVMARCQILLSAEVAGAGVEFTVAFSKNAASLDVKDKFTDTWDHATDHYVSAFDHVQALDGDKFNVAIRWRRIGNAATAIIKNAEIDLLRVGD